MSRRGKALNAPHLLSCRDAGQYELPNCRYKDVSIFLDPSGTLDRTHHLDPAFAVSRTSFTRHLNVISMRTYGPS